MQKITLNAYIPFLLMLLTPGAFLFLSGASAQGADPQPRFGVWAGAGSGVLVANENSIPFRLNVGGELLLGENNRIGIGYQMAVPISGDQFSIAGVVGTPLRMVHYFPRVRLFLFPPDFATRNLSVSLAPGIAVQSTGWMMSSKKGTVSVNFATQIAAEYHCEIERNIDFGLEGTYEYFSRVNGTDPLPRVILWGIGGNLHFYFGSKGSLL
ncbi:hypothetical protein WDW86_05390 [Bdellovibrionota bacterium FG-2]